MHYDTNKYTVWTWKHPVMLHWIINPGLVINELLLGQRVPKVMLIEKGSEKPLVERSFIPCPHCHTLHPNLKWSLQNKAAFGNWFGLYCNACGGIIPCMRNAASAVVLAVTAPLWIWFAKALKRKWLAREQQKFAGPLKLTTPEYNWVAEGISWGFFMFIFMDLVFPWLTGESYRPLRLVFEFVMWMAGGLGFSYMTKKFLFRKSKSRGDKVEEVV